MKNIRSWNGSVIMALLLISVVRNNAFVPSVVKHNLAKQHQQQEQLSYAFSVSQHQQRRKKQQQQQRRPLVHFLAAKDTVNEKGTAKTSDEEEISDLDARVLQSMLSEDKLDLNTEENLKRQKKHGITI